jgi:lysophospholipase L1-like esterase
MVQTRKPRNRIEEPRMNTPKLLFRYLSSLVIAGFAIIWVHDAQTAEVEPSSPRWEKAIQEFESSDKESPTKPGGNLFIGSSSIRMWKSLSEDFPGVPVTNRGFGGSQIVDSTFFASRIIAPYAPKRIFLYAGDNDVAAGKNAKTVLEDFKRFIHTVHKALPKTKIFFIAIKPSLKRWSMAGEMTEANLQVKKLAETSPLLGYVDVWTPMLNDKGEPKPEVFIADGLHMNRAGYDIWTTAVRPFL